MLMKNRNQVLESWENLIFEPKQLRGNILDLTLNSIYATTTQGSIDFGGTEYNPSKLEKIIPKKKER